MVPDFEGTSLCCVLLKVAFVDSANAVSILTDRLELRGFGDCQNSSMHFTEPLSFRVLQEFFEQ
jgi:hypothetical protein